MSSTELRLRSWNSSSELSIPDWFTLNEEYVNANSGASRILDSQHPIPIRLWTANTNGLRVVQESTVEADAALTPHREDSWVGVYLDVLLSFESSFIGRYIKSTAGLGPPINERQVAQNMHRQKGERLMMRQ
jgi:hypothetical protein